MSRDQDDPRDVLMFLNSLGFVGITAPQLKLFMKDLKLYRKIKKQEQNEWKEKSKEKLRNRQHRVLRQQNSEVQSSELFSSESSKETSSLKIHFQYSSKDKENDCKRLTSSSESQISESYCYVKNRRDTCKSKNNTVLEEFSKLSVRQNSPDRETKEEQKEQKGKKREQVEKLKLDRVTSPENSKRTSRSQTRSVTTESARTRITQRSSSRSKSFIRPWKLQTESQQCFTRKKSDPVMLYQKYQQGWNKISFPGEERHTKIRWEIREKMLGTDQNSKPVLRRSKSAATIRKKTS